VNVFDPANNGVFDDTVSYQSTTVPATEVAVKVLATPVQLVTFATIGLEGFGFIVKFNVTTLSHPAALVPVHVLTPEVVYVVPFQAYDAQAETV
jgi:hypothetical protein